MRRFPVNIKYIISLLIFILSIAIPYELSAQSSGVQKKAEKVDQNNKQELIDQNSKEQAREETFDTAETLDYMSSRMFFQLKKRLHLTDEEDEQKEQAEKKVAEKAKFTIFGIKIEKH